MDYGEIRELALLMKEMDLTSLEYKGGGSSVKLYREPAGSHAPQAPVAAPREQPAAMPAEAPKAAAAAGGVTVKSPVVGVFYAAESEDKEPFVSVGDAVHTGDVLCLIEAMKMMNEITAECDGVIAEICAENKQLVEFNQPLFRIVKV